MKKFLPRIIVCGVLGIASGIGASYIPKTYMCVSIGILIFGLIWFVWRNNTDLVEKVTS